MIHTGYPASCVIPVVCAPGCSESWSLARLPPPAQMAVTASRVAWSARVGSSEMSEKLQKTVRVAESLEHCVSGTCVPCTVAVC